MPDTTTATSAGDQRGCRSLSYLWLIYLGVILFQPVSDPDAGAADWLVVAAVVGAFVPVYVVAEQRPEFIRWCLMATILIGLAAAPFNSGAGVLFVYAAVYAATSEPRAAAVWWFAGLSFLVILTGVVSRVPFPWQLTGLVPSLVFIWVSGLSAMVGAEQEREQARLRLEHARVRHLATISERERIARDLHDLLGHTLTSVVVRAQLVQRLAAVDSQRAAAEAGGIERTARHALTEVRAAVSGWRQASLDAELENAREGLVAAGVDVDVALDPGLTLVPSVEGALALALREAVTNVARHAGARTCRLALGRDNGEVRLVVSDDGVGGHARDGNGLTGMRERIAAVGGRVERSGAAGTTVTVAVPAQIAT